MSIKLKDQVVPSSIIIEECIDQESSPFGFAVKKRKVVLSTGSIEQEIESYIEALKGLPSNYDCIKYWHNEERSLLVSHIWPNQFSVSLLPRHVWNAFSVKSLYTLAGIEDLLQRATFERKFC